MTKSKTTVVDRAEIVSIIKQIYLKGKKEGDVTLTDSQSLTSDLGLDSIEILELIVQLETQFGIQVPDSFLRIESFETVGSVVQITQQLSRGDIFETDR